MNTILKSNLLFSFKLLICWFVFLAPGLAFAQTDKEFWFVAPQVFDAGRDFGKPINLRITSSSSAATVTISMPANASFRPIVNNIAANSTLSVDLTPWIVQIESTPANTTLDKGILITSTTEITAYYEVVSGFCNCNPEIFSLKGKNALGTEFFISSQSTYDQSSQYAAATNSFDIVATKNNTRVTITPSKNIVGHVANIPFTIVLNAGQTYSAVALSGLASGHLQGSYISSDSPIAVTIKDDLVQVSACADLIGDQTVPTSVLGTEYIVTKGYLQTNDHVYVMATANATAIYIDGRVNPTVVLAKGESFTIDLSNPSIYIRSDKNIYVYHFTGNGCEAGSAIIPKLNCTGSQSVSLVRSKPELFAVLITTKNGNQGNFAVNGNANFINSSDFTQVPGTGGAYVTARIDLSGVVPVGSASTFTNSSGNFSLGFINGGTTGGTLFGFFSNFKASSVQSSLVETCPSSPVQLLAFGGLNYRWSPSAGLNDPNIANPLASPSVTTNYTVFITTAEGCLDSAKVQVRVLSPKIIDTTVSICSGESYLLPSGRTVNTSGTHVDAIPYKSGCDSLITTVHLTVNSMFSSLTIAASANNICAGSSVTFTAIPVNEGSSPTYQWQINGINTGNNSRTFTNSALKNGDKISCMMTTNLPCSLPANNQSNSITALVNPLPVINTSGDQTIKKGSITRLNATASDTLSYINWSPSTGLDNVNTLTPLAKPSETINYTLTVQTVNGCISTTQIKVTVLDHINVPNAFTPNGDGVNDRWEITNLADYPNCVVQVFNRWGNKVYHSTGYPNAWDGTTKDKPLSSGTYYYLISLNNVSDPISGYVMILK